MCQITQLETFISQYRDYRDVAEEAYRINPDWREQTWTRGLRRSLKIEAVYKDNKPNSPIIGYKPKNIPTVAKPVRVDKFYDIDSELRTILKERQKEWKFGDPEYFRFIGILNGKNQYAKESLLREYLDK